MTTMKRRSFTVNGLINQPVFQMCTEAAIFLQKEHPNEFHVDINRELPLEFYARRRKLLEGKQIENESMSVIVVETGGAVFTGEGFLDEVKRFTAFRILKVPVNSPGSYENMAFLSWKSYLRSRGNIYAWIDVSISGALRGRITFELFSEVVPRTCNNFWHLCSGDFGSVVPDGAEEPVNLSYKNTTFFRTLKGAWVMGGDVSKGHTGKGGYSCYGRYFPDESYAIPHDRAGVIGMCNDGAHTNASSFYITVKPMSWMNGKYVAFGRVMDGMDVVEAIHAVHVKHNQGPVEAITISDCGVIDLTD